MTLEFVVKNGTLCEEEQQWCIDLIKSRFPDREITKIELICDDGGTKIRYTLGRCNLYKMGGYLIGDPMAWNDAKRAEYLATVPNPL